MKSSLKIDKALMNLWKGIFKKSLGLQKKKNILELIDKLEKPTIADEADLKELYYKENAKKFL